MGMDRNTLIGFGLLIVLFFGYFYYTRQGQLELEKEKAKQDSIAKANQPLSKADTTLALGIAGEDSTLQNNSVDSNAIALAQIKNTVVENELIKVTFTNKGGQPAMVELKNFNNRDSVPVRLVEGNGFDRFTYAINTGNNQSAQIADLYFNEPVVKKMENGAQSIQYQLTLPGGKTVEHQYILPANEYMMNWNLQLKGSDQLLTQQALNLIWQTRANQQEKDIKYEKQQSQVTFLEGGEFDYYNVISRNNYKFEKEISWVSVKQQFFSQMLISKTPFQSGEINWQVPDDSIGVVANATTNLRFMVPQGNLANIPFQLYYGPNDFGILKKYDLELENNVNLGQGFYAFVKYINRLIILPLFNFFKSFLSNYGIVILLLTVIIRLLISPLTYSSYLSGAKMKALRPELNALKEKMGDDQQGYAMEQMKLFREAGVNPLGGCIPALLQIPIFFALFSFFNSNVALRGQSFLWADDLSAYDVIAELPFHVWGLGDHISLFTLLAVVTSLAISLYSMNMSPDQNNPMLKYMPYIFPIIMLGIFNSMPSALTWYYTVSNVITLILQFVIQNFIIDHKKVLAKIEANRKAPKKTSKWQERMAQMQEAQKKMNEMKNKQK